MGTDYTFYIEQQVNVQRIERDFFADITNRYLIYLPHLIQTLPGAIEVVDGGDWTVEYRVSSDSFSALVAHAQKLSSLSDDEFKETLPEHYRNQLDDHFFTNAYDKKTRKTVAKFLEQIKKNIGNNEDLDWWPAKGSSYMFTDVSEYFPNIKDPSNWNLIMTVS